MSTILVCREVSPRMIERREGCIINTSSNGAFVGLEKGAIYCVAKAGAFITLAAWLHNCDNTTFASIRWPQDQPRPPE